MLTFARNQGRPGPMATVQATAIGLLNALLAPIRDWATDVELAVAVGTWMAHLAMYAWITAVSWSGNC